MTIFPSRGLDADVPGNAGPTVARCLKEAELLPHPLQLDECACHRDTVVRPVVIDQQDLIVLASLRQETLYALDNIRSTIIDRRDDTYLHRITYLIYDESYWAIPLFVVAP